MRHTASTDVFTALFGLWWIAAMFSGLFLTVAVPLMAWSITRSLKGIRRELAQLNETMSLPSHRA